MGPMAVPVLDSGNAPLHAPVPMHEVAPVVVQLAVVESPAFREVGRMTSTAVGPTASVAAAAVEAVAATPLLAEHPANTALIAARISKHAKDFETFVMNISCRGITATKC
jgi:hypothetical protein